MTENLTYIGSRLPGPNDKDKRGQPLKPYLVDEDLKEAVNLAIYLERPLLLRGEPGCGKTRLAQAVAFDLGLDIEPWHIKSTSRAEEGLYRYDAVSRLHETQLALQENRAPLPLEKFIHPGPLGRAFQAERRTVVLIDEIDLHLHPKWQRTIMAYLSERFVNTQFIVTAHSPLIVQAAENANIVVLKREGDQVVIHQQAQAVKGWRVDQLLTSDLFDLESARSPHYESLLEKRRQILSKATLSETDQTDLRKLEAEIGDLPTAETTEDIEAMDIIRRAAQILQQDA